MTESKLGENIAREWSEEPRGQELWEALQLIKSDPPAGLEKLTELAESGSTLAMGYLGNKYQRGRHGVPKDNDLCEYWLRRAATEGSIEGGYILAWHLVESDRTDAAIEEFQRLADRDYSPALYSLGRLYSGRYGVERDLKKALSYFSSAEEKGHLYASHQISQILMRESTNPLSWLRGLSKWMVKMIPYIKTSAEYPKSDRLRR